MGSWVSFDVSPLPPSEQNGSQIHLPMILMAFQILHFFASKFWSQKSTHLGWFWMDVGLQNVGKIMKKSISNPGCNFFVFVCDF